MEFELVLYKENKKGTNIDKNNRTEKKEEREREREREREKWREWKEGVNKR